MPGPSVHYFAGNDEDSRCECSGQTCSSGPGYEVKLMDAEALLKIVVFTFDRKLFRSMGAWTYLDEMI